MQDCRSSSRRKPRRQKHWNEPALFWHVWSQPPLAAKHSSTSTQRESDSEQGRWRRERARPLLTALDTFHSLEVTQKVWMISRAVAAAAVRVESVSCRAVALVTSGVVGAVLLAAGAPLAALVHVCQAQRAARVRERTDCGSACSYRMSSREL